MLYVCRLFQGQIFVFDCLFENWDSSAVAENTVSVLFKHRPNIMYYEKFNGWDAYDKLIAARAQSKGIVQVPLQWEKGSQAFERKAHPHWIDQGDAHKPPSLALRRDARIFTARIATAYQMAKIGPSRRFCGLFGDGSRGPHRHFETQKPSDACICRQLAKEAGGKPSDR